MSCHAQWNIVRVAGTDLYEISHEITGSLLASRWPPVDQQSTVGTHSPANMGLTSRWAVDISQDGQIRFVAFPGLFVLRERDVEVYIIASVFRVRISCF